MARAEDFDAFYHATRKSLLHETYALTASAERAATAVERAYLRAWGQWHKVRQLNDPLSWVRGEAWRSSESQLPLRNRIRHRVSSFGDDVSWSTRAVELEALQAIPPDQRRAVVLHYLGQLPVARIAREMGIAQSTAAALLATGEQNWPGQRPPLPEALAAIADDLVGVTLMRASSIRRAGERHRRRHALAGVAAATALLIGGGLLMAQPEPEPVRVAADSPAPRTQSVELVGGEALIRHTELRPVTAARQPWRTTGSADATNDDDLYALCQLEPRADPEAEQALIREYSLRKRPTAGVHVVEESADVSASKAAFRRLSQWFGGCESDGVQLMRSFRVAGLGDEANAFVLREGGKKETFVTVAITRVDSVTSAFVASREGGGAVNPERLVQSTSPSVGRVCAALDGTTCPTDPELRDRPPVPRRQNPAFLDAVDLPPVSNVDAAWIGTEPKRQQRFSAGTSCERADYGKAKRAQTRVFLIPKATKLPRRFGLDETVAVFGNAKQAQRFVNIAKTRARRCADRQASAQVRVAKGFNRGPYTGAVWRFEFELANESTIFYRVGLVRERNKVALVSMSPTDRFDVRPAQFEGLLLRAAQRLSHMPE